MAGMAIGGINGYNQSFSPQNISSRKPAEQLASGKKINSAADDAAGMAIAEKLDNQANGSYIASDNAKDMRNLLNVADGGMGQIAEGLGRIRELAVQAQNGIYTDDDKKIFQEEINGILSNINDIGNNTQFNGKTLLDGSFTAQNAVIGPNGESAEINIGSVLTDELGITGFDVMSDSLDVIDGALDKALEQMSNVGAQTNRMEYAGRAAENQGYNMEVARSRLEDADVAQASMENNRRRITEQTQLAMQKMQMQGMGAYLQLIG